MKRVAVPAFLLLLALASLAPSLQAEGSSGPIFINLISGPEDLHSVSMGLALAKHALEDGHPVHIFMNVHAPKFAAADLSPSLKFEDFAPVKTLLADIVAKGGKVYVCKHCAHLAKVPLDKMAPGMVPAEHQALFKAIPQNALSFTY